MTLRFTRRSSLALFGGAAALPLVGSAARAQDLTIHGGQFRPVAVAISAMVMTRALRRPWRSP